LEGCNGIVILPLFSTSNIVINTEI
jgi:hypothetical protein